MPEEIVVDQHVIAYNLNIQRFVESTWKKDVEKKWNKKKKTTISLQLVLFC